MILWQFYVTKKYSSVYFAESGLELGLEYFKTNIQ